MVTENGAEPAEAGAAVRSASRSPQPRPDAWTNHAQPKPKANGVVNPLEKIEQLLTCSICLDRFKQPKLLPCHHTYCLPCLDSYADTVTRNLKCPECRSEHPVPYEGAKAFPNNFTLARFLDIHLEATDDNQEELEAYIQRYNMERCKICDEKAEVEVCAHCDRKACKDCRNAHMEMVKRDLGRLLNQIKRLSNRIKEANQCVKKGIGSLAENAGTTRTEIRDYFQRYQGELKRREEHFLSEVALYEENEARLLRTLGDRLDAEETNLTDGCRWAEAVLSGQLEAKEDLLCRFKAVFSDGIEYLRNFQPDSDDLFSKKIRFSPGDDAAKLPQAICNFGELTVYMPQFAGRYLPMEQQYLPRPLRMGLESDSYRTSLRTREEERQAKARSASRSYRRRHTHGDDEWAALRELRLRADSGRSSPPSAAQSPFAHSPLLPPPPASPKEAEARPTRTHLAPEDEAAPVGGRRARRAGRERSSFIVDEVLLSPDRSARDAFMAAYQREHEQQHQPQHHEQRDKDRREQLEKEPHEQHGREPRQAPPKVVVQKPPTPKNETKTAKSAHSPSSSNGQEATTSSRPDDGEAEEEEEEHEEAPVTVARRQKFKIISRTTPTHVHRRSVDLSLQTSLDEEPGEPQRSARQRRAAATPAAAAGLRPRRLFGASVERSGGDERAHAATAAAAEPTTSGTRRWLERRQRRALRSHTNPDLFGALDEEERRRLRAAARRDRDPAEEDEVEEACREPGTSRPRRDSIARRVQQLLDDPELNELLADSTRPATAATRPSAAPLSPPPALSTANFAGGETEADARRSRFATRSRSSLELTPFIDYGRMSKPRVVFGQKGDAPGQLNWPRGIAVLGGGSFAVADSSNHRIQIFDGNGNLKKRFGTYGSMDGQLDSCAAVAYNRVSKHLVVSDRYNHRVQLFDLDGRFVRGFGGSGRESGKFNNPWGVAVDALGMIYVCDKDNHRVQVFDKNGTFMLKFGQRGDGAGQFNHPLFAAVHHRTGNLFVADSANHRVCVLDGRGAPIHTFGAEGFGTGQLKLPRGIVVDEQGFVAVADSGNNRVQIFSPDGKFVHGFGTWGSSPGQLKGIEGMGLMDGQLVVADRENHRIQIF